MTYPPIQVRTFQIRTYHGKTQGEAATRLAQDGPAMSGAGYRPSLQSWAETGGLSLVGKAWLALAVLAAVAGALAWPLWIGAIVCLLIGLTGRKHSGELTVTWTRG